MSQVLLTGATGLVGGHLLRLLQNEPSISAIAAPTRRPLAPAEGVFNPHDPQLTDAWRRWLTRWISFSAVWERRAGRPGAKRPLSMLTTRWWLIRR